MAKYTRFRLIINNNIDIKKLKFDLEYWVNVSIKKYGRPGGSLEKKSGGKNLIFNSDGLTKLYVLPDNATKARYIIRTTTKDKDGDDIVATINAEVFKKMKSNNNKCTTFPLKTTPAGTKKDPNTIKKAIIDNTEVGWVIIERHCSIEKFLRKIYKDEPTKKEENIFRSNNPHLTGTPVLSLQPGDFVILSNTSNDKNKELAQIKKDAKAAKIEFDKIKKEFGFDSGRFARNIDFLHDVFLNSEYVALTDKTNNKQEPPSNDINYAAIAAGTSQGIVTFNEISNKKVTETYAKIVEAMDYEKINKTKLANPKNFKLFKRKYANLFKNFDNSFSQSYFKYNFGIQTGKLRQQINKNVHARPSSYKGGIRAYVENFRNMGKVDKFTKVGGNLLIAVSVTDATIKVGDAYATGNSSHTRKTIIRETLKLEGSLGGAGLASGGVMIAAAAFGIGTAGLGFIVVGVVAAGAGIVGGYYGGVGGAELTDLIYQ